MVDRLNVYKLIEMKNDLARRSAIRAEAKRKKARKRSGIVNVAELEGAALRQRASEVTSVKVTGLPKSELQHLLLEKEKELRAANVQIQLLGEELRKAINPTEREARIIEQGGNRKDRIESMREMAESGHEWCETRYRNLRARLLPNDQDHYLEQVNEELRERLESNQLQRDLYLEKLHLSHSETINASEKMRDTETKELRDLRDADYKILSESIDDRDERISEDGKMLLQLQRADASGHSGFVDKVAILVRAAAGIGRAQVDEVAGEKDDRDPLDVDVIDALEKIVVSLENLGTDVERLREVEQESENPNLLTSGGVTL